MDDEKNIKRQLLFGALREKHTETNPNACILDLHDRLQVQEALLAKVEARAALVRDALGMPAVECECECDRGKPGQSPVVRDLHDRMKALEVQAEADKKMVHALELSAESDGGKLFDLETRVAQFVAWIGTGVGPGGDCRNSSFDTAAIVAKLRELGLVKGDK